MHRACRRGAWETQQHCGDSIRTLYEATRDWWMIFRVGGRHENHIPRAVKRSAPKTQMAKIICFISKYTQGWDKEIMHGQGSVKEILVQSLQNKLITFCRWEGCSKSPKGELSGSSKASNARVLSNSAKISGFSSPLSARCVWANSRADSMFLLRINSIRCCCWKHNKRRKHFDRYFPRVR